ncbi:MULTISPECIES: hypothetical protein [unclassified Streptomyces]|uniref:hypothetical protein n=1 Tax=unclassified Streptomyces TaxID=2593676 RepID=UPI0007C68104|nr:MULTISPECIES: hypothetical protein [unclassified Streptomyces]
MRPRIGPGVLSAQQDRGQHAAHVARFTVLARQGLGVVLHGRLPVLILHHGRELGHDAEDLRLRTRSEVPTEFGDPPFQQFVAQVQRQREFKGVSHSALSPRSDSPTAAEVR